MKKLILTIALIMLINAPLGAQNDTNVLPLHTGKSYVLDFPVKVTRVVGGDPSAMELNLFKKDEDAPTDTGYQLLISPISEKNTNIIVWTEKGLYVFEVIIDNSSLYTADTIVDVPMEKKFVVPITQVAQTNIQPVETENNYPVEQELKADEMVKNPNDEAYTVFEDNEAPAPLVEEPPALNSEQAASLPPFQPPVVEQNPSSSSETGAASSFELDEPPAPDKDIQQDNREPVKLKPQIKITSTKKKPAPVKEEIIEFQVKHNNKEPLQTNKDSQQHNKAAKDSNKLAFSTESLPLAPEETVKIESRPQHRPQNTIQAPQATPQSNLFNGNMEFSNDGLTLTVDSITKENNALKISMTLKNSSTICRYLLWDLTRIDDNKGNTLYVRNHNMPPGIITPGKKIKGEIIAYPKSDKTQLPSGGMINLALSGLQGDTIFNAQIPIGK